jgi:LiaF transmembrane domain/Cell wall-active antibiotics response LiaF, C-terminal
MPVICCSRRSAQIALGVCVVAFGLALTAANVGWVSADLVWRYSPVLLIAYGLIISASSDARSRRLFGGLVAVTGAWILVEQFYVLRFDIRDWWPLLLVIGGILMISRATGRSTDVTLSDQTLSAVAIWSGVRRRVAAPAFRRADLTAVMGGIELDLRPAGTSERDAVIDVFAFWGGIEITVPPDWDVRNEVVAILGGVGDKSTGTQASQHHLILRGFVVMGGIEIKT